MGIKVNFGEKPLVENEERQGWSADDSGLYPVVIREAYITQSQHGAYALNLQTESPKKEKRNHTIYFTNRAGDVFYVDKKTKENKMMPNYQLFTEMFAVAGGITFQESLGKTKAKTLMLMDWESRKEVPTKVETLPAIVGKRLILGIKKGVKNKFSKGKETAEKQEYNEIVKTFDFSTGASLKEMQAQAKSTSKVPLKLKDKDKWIKYWDERIEDKYNPIESEEEDKDLGGDVDLGFGEDETEEEVKQDAESDDLGDDTSDFTEEELAEDDEDDLLEEDDLEESEEEEEDPFFEK